MCRATRLARCQPIAGKACRSTVGNKSDPNKLMNSYPCQNCGLVNWAKDENCRRCKTPKSGVGQINNQMSVALANFGSAYGVSIGEETNYQKHRNRRTIDQSDLAAAQKDINFGWKAGQAWCILAGIASTAIFAITFLTNSEGANRAVSSALISVVVMLPILAIGAGITYGVYERNRACAVILLVLSALNVFLSLVGLLIEAQGGAAIRLLIGLLFLYYFWRGVRRTFRYHKLIRN